jgi:5,5'-dehydrodivanillate O-demethylase
MLSADKNEVLTRVGPGTPMGRLLRHYWHPVAPVGELAERPVKPVRLLGEDLVLYRAGDGGYGLMQRQCPHRGADLAYGWPEESGLRCMYHGWLFDRGGRCVQQPYEDCVAPESRFKDKIRTTAYPTAVLGGLIWAYLGPDPAPPVPDYEPFSWTRGFVQIVLSEIPCNWFQCQENSIDPVHFEWLHMNWSAVQRNPDDPTFGPAHTGLEFEEFEQGFVCVRHTGSSQMPWASVRKGPQSDGLICLWPNALYTGNHFEWRVPVDDTTTLIVTWWYSVLPDDVEPVVQDPVPYWYGPVRAEDGRWLAERPLNQDMAAWLGQGPVADRTTEHLGRSDVGIILLRKRFFDELDRMERGEPLKNTGHAEAPIKLPVVDRDRYTEGISRERFEAELAAKRRRFSDGSYYTFQVGQPEHVRRSYEQAAGIAAHE